MSPPIGTERLPWKVQCASAHILAGKVKSCLDKAEVVLQGCGFAESTSWLVRLLRIQLMRRIFSALARLAWSLVIPSVRVKRIVCMHEEKLTGDLPHGCLRSAKT